MQSNRNHSTHFDQEHSSVLQQAKIQYIENAVNPQMNEEKEASPSQGK